MQPFRALITGLLAATTLGGCAFAPNLGEGLIVCGADGSCPPAYHCAADDRCYQHGGPDLLASPADFAVVPDLGAACVPTCMVACSPCCQETCTDPSSCDVTCPVGGCDCRMGCSHTQTCSLNCSAAGICTGAIDSATTAELTCAAGSSCSFTCIGASTCLLNCRGDAQCSVACVAPAVCTVNGPCTGMMSCPNNTTVCNRACP